MVLTEADYCPHTGDRPPPARDLWACDACGRITPPRELRPVVTRAAAGPGGFDLRRDRLCPACAGRRG